MKPGSLRKRLAMEFNGTGVLMRPHKDDPKPIMAICMECISNEEARELYPDHRLSHGYCGRHYLEYAERENLLDPEEKESLDMMRRQDKIRNYCFFGLMGFSFGAFFYFLGHLV